MPTLHVPADRVIEALELAHNIAEKGTPQIVMFPFGVPDDVAQEIHEKAELYIQGKIPGFTIGKPTTTTTT